jgi:DNA mismatch repair protein MutS
VIKRAKSVLKSLEDSDSIPHKPKTVSQSETAQLSMLDMSGNDIVSTLQSTDINTLTPIEALNMLFEFKKKL